MEDETSRHMEHIYGSLEEADIPWNRTEPPSALVELVESGTLSPCRALDVGCGTGNYSLYLARQGFEVTGVDLSPSAIRMARKKAGELGLPVRFEVVDMRKDVAHVGGGFAFALEWMIMHHVLPHERPGYLANLLSLLGDGATCLSVSFSAEDPGFGDPPHGNWRRSPMGPQVYCSYLEELVTLFSPAFHIIEKDVREIPGRAGNNTVNYLYLMKR